MSAMWRGTGCRKIFLAVHFLEARFRSGTLATSFLASSILAKRSCPVRFARLARWGSYSSAMNKRDFYPKFLGCWTNR